MDSTNTSPWGPPTDPLIDTSRGARPTAPSNPRRRHPAQKARRVAGLSAVAASAALVGYMVTANAAGSANGSSNVPTSTVPTVTPTPRPEADDDQAAQPASSLPTVSVPARNQPTARPAIPNAGRPMTSTHGS